jgi:ATP-binding cassette, subfamily B, bacterial
VLVSLLLFAVAVLQVLNPQLVRHYINRVVGGGAVSSLVWVAVAYLVVAAIIQLLRVWAAYVGENVAWSMTNALRVDLTEHCLGLDYQFHVDHTPGELIERVDGDVTTLATFLSSAAFVIASNVMLVVGILISLFVTDWRIACVILLYAVTALTVLLFIRGIALGAWTRVRETSAAMFGFVAEWLSSVEEVHTNNAERFVLERLDRRNDEMLRLQRGAMVRSNVIFTVMHGLYLLGYGGALAVGAVLYTRGLTSLGTVFLIISYTNFIYMPLNEVRSQIQDMQRAAAGLRRVSELLGFVNTVPDGPGVTFSTGPLPVAFHDVSFRYAPGAPYAVRGLSLTIAPGEVLGVMGRTGSGKTTVARLLARMYDPTSGVVSVGGHDLKEAKVADLRNAIGVVTQNVQIFRGTVRDNVTLFDETVSNEVVIEAVQRLGLGPWLARLPDGIDTVLEGQASMSAGEAQLFAVCRAFLRDPGLVILDEVSSRLDAETEQLLETALSSLLAGRTAVVIGHRLSAVDRADRIVFLEGGEVVEVGTPAQLLEDANSRLSQLMATATEGAIR